MKNLFSVNDFAAMDACLDMLRQKNDAVLLLPTETVYGLVCRFDSDKGRWFVEVPEYGERAKEKFDVTEYMERILRVSGCDRVITEHRKFNLNRDDAVWVLRPGLALAVGEMWAYTKVGRKLRYVTLRRSAILTKEGK